jgi:hypothetical protein
LGIKLVLGYITTLMVKPIWSVEAIPITARVKRWFIARKIGTKGGK